MAYRIIKDIRYYESNSIDKLYPDFLGAVFHPTTDTNYIGQRIARKLNEFKYSYEEFDHIYIILTTNLNENELLISERNLDKRIKCIYYGFPSKSYNALTDNDKNYLLKAITFKVLKHISASENSEQKKVEEVEAIINRFDTEIRINYKTKETNNYKIDINYQINPASASTRAIVTYIDKKSNSKCEGFIPLQLYEDIYYLIDTVTVNDDTLIFNPKKSYIADLCSKKYSAPIRLQISELKNF
jgi:hypothetical protein